MRNPKPILFDEWQDAVKIWETIRKACDDNPEKVKLTTELVYANLNAT